MRTCAKISALTIVGNVDRYRGDITRSLDGDEVLAEMTRIGLSSEQATQILQYTKNVTGRTELGVRDLIHALIHVLGNSISSTISMTSSSAEPLNFDFVNHFEDLELRETSELILLIMSGIRSSAKL